MQVSRVAAFSGANARVAPVAQCRPGFSRRTLSTVAQSAPAPAVQLPVKGVDGSSMGTASMSLKVAQESAKGLVHRYLVYVLQNQRQGTASTLTRSEVRGGGKKPYAQKGTGNARRGSNVSPLFPGGGVTFGPKPKDWSIRMNKKERRLALATALQSAAADMTVIEPLADKLTSKKTRDLVAALSAAGVSPDQKCLLILAAPHEHIQLAGRNIANLAINTADAIKVFDVLNAEKIVIEQGAAAHVQSFYGAKEQ